MKKNKNITELILENQELALKITIAHQVLTDKLIKAKKEHFFLNEEKENQVAALITANKLMSEKIVKAHKELAHQNELKKKRAAELVIANKELLISERKLSKQRYLFEIMFNSITDGIFITNKKREIILANKGVELIFGYKPDDLIGKSTKILYADNDNYEQAGKNVFNKNSLTLNNHYITYYKDKSNKEFPGETFGTKLLDSEGEWIGSLGIIRDISERMHFIEDIQKAKEKAEDSDRLKSAFLANINHEIRTPMNSILGFSELLMNQELTMAKQKKYHEIVNVSGKRLMNLINEIVDISKIVAKELKLNPTEFNLNKLLDQLHEQFLISPKNKNTTISIVKALKDIDSFINIDETRLVQVLSNLLENALKYTHNGTVEFGYTLDKDELHFFVKDSGVGINKKDHLHIFERFGQSDNEILKVKDGTGLGLAISKGIVELMGGQIWVESELYKGATFHFTIPNCVVTPEKKSNNKKSVENVVISTTKNILIAEDEETNFWFLEAALDGQPFNLVHVLNGKEAVETMQANNNIDLILMDFNMPIMNGMDATKEIRKTNPTIPIIALTAYSMMADKEKALSIGCTDYLSKPVSKALLLETINKYITAENPH